MPNESKKKPFNVTLIIVITFIVLGAAIWLTSRLFPDRLLHDLLLDWDQHATTVTDGEALVLYLLPDGEINFTKQ